MKSVTLHDEGTVELWDMSSNFVFSEKDLGKNRALASIQKLQELNNAVAISTLTTKLTNEQLSDFQVIFFNLLFFFPFEISHAFYHRLLASIVIYIFLFIHLHPFCFLLLVVM